MKGCCGIIWCTPISTIASFYASKPRTTNTHHFNLWSRNTTFLSHTHPKKHFPSLTQGTKTDFDCRFRNGHEFPLHCSTSCREISEEDDDSIVVINFYRFVSIEDPQAEVAKQLTFLEVLCNRLCYY